MAGAITDLFGLRAAIWVVVAITAASSLVVALRMYETHRLPRSARQLPWQRSGAGAPQPTGRSTLVDE